MKQYKRGITFGAFDPLHYGHVRLFQRAKEQCEELIVCASTDEYIQVKKNREPAVPEMARAVALAAITYIDVVDGQSIEKGKKELIEKYQPDVIFVGSDWTPETFEGEGLGIPVVYLPRTEGTSSTDIRYLKNLEEALDYAISIIENYQMDIRSSKETMPSLGINLAEKGFCQGKVYKEAIEDINKIKNK